jgi:hypothetical protein
VTVFGFGISIKTFNATVHADQNKALISNEIIIATQTFSSYYFIAPMHALDLFEWPTFFMVL